MSDPIGSVSGLASGIQWRDLVDQIVKVETTRQLDPITKRQSADTAAVTAWNSYQTVVATLRDAAAKIATQSSLVASTATVGTSPSGRSLLTASATSSATPGSFAVQVDALAAAEKVQTSVFNSSTTALGLTGAFSINGASIAITAVDSLSAIRDRINAANTGSSASHVSASILSGADGSARLILSTDVTGAEGIRLTDATSESTGVLAQLGISDGTTSLQVGANGAAQSFGFSSTTAALAAMIGVTLPPPSFIYVDGKAISVDLATDSLSAIAARVNAAGGHAALTANGSTNKLEISGSLTGDTRTLEVLGLTRAGRTAVKQSVVTDTVLTLDDLSPVAGTSLLTSLGNGVGSATVSVGETISIRGTRADGTAANATFAVGAGSTLNDLLSAVSTALGTVSRPVTATLDGGRIRVTDSMGGDSALAMTLVANNETTGTLAFGGTTTSDVGRLRRVSAGADAQIRIDGTTVRRSSNSISDAIAGVTLQLGAVEANAPVTVVIARDTDAAVASVKAFATAYNGALSFFAQQKATGGPLANVSTLRSTITTFRQSLLSDVVGLGANGGITRASQVGVAIDKNGALLVDAAALKTALATNGSAISSLFSTAASVAGTGLTSPAWGSDSQAGTYTVHVSTLATFAQSTSGAFATYVAGGAGSDTLAIHDTASGNTANVTIADGTSIDAVVTALNTAFTTGALSLSASKDGGGHVVLTSTAAGSAPTFSVTGATGGSLAGLATVTAGTDTTGWFQQGAFTYAATGVGQTLVGAATAPVSGLSVRYTGASAAADVGTVTLTLGVAGAMERAATAVVRPNDGTVALRTSALLDHATSLNARADAVQERIDRYRAALVKQYTAMEAALSRIQSQQSFLSGQINSLNSSR